ncbi:acylphosphatase [Fructilactobacillus sp. Tb1]|uniref:acylphosphatase n=1 Tax=Fructilactobacillus sp. Tb1 TaxID=3422304 RepID=UPI003D267D5B
MKTYLILIRGKVQGVGFRHTTCLFANELHVTGTIENLPNGEVKIIAQGTINLLRTFIDKLHHFPNPRARISHIYVRLADFDKHYDSFKVKF